MKILSTLKNPRFWGPVFAIAISVAIFVFREEIIKLSGYGYVGLFLLNVLGSATIFLPTPMFLATFAAATVLNPWIVTVVVALGSTLGELTGYLAGKGGAGIVDQKAERIKGWMEKYGAFALFVLAAIPNPFFDIAGIIAGATNIPVWKFLLALWLGKLIKFGAIALLGYASFQSL